MERRRHVQRPMRTDDDVMHRSTHRAARVASVAPPHPSPPSAAPAVLILANGRARDVERLERSAERAASSPPRPSSLSRRESSRSHRSIGRSLDSINAHAHHELQSRFTITYAPTFRPSSSNYLGSSIPPPTAVLLYYRQDSIITTMRHCTSLTEPPRHQPKSPVDWPPH